MTSSKGADNSSSSAQQDHKDSESKSQFIENIANIKLESRVAKVDGKNEGIYRVSELVQQCPSRFAFSRKHEADQEITKNSCVANPLGI